MKAGVIVFPGSNCDRDVRTTLQHCGFDVRTVWHGDPALPEGLELIVIPGGFSYGDYLRSGAMAAHSPIMAGVKRFAEGGGYVLGICNGFQVLTECGLLPGTLMRNAGLKFICSDAYLRVESTDAAYTRSYQPAQIVNFPIAHHDGNYVADADTLKRLEDNGQIAFRYCTPEGDLSDDANPNGSVAHIAGVYSENKKVLGLMPHPERHADPLTGGIDGKALFEGLLAA